MLQKIKDFLKEEEGLAAVEYAVLVGVVVAGVLAFAPYIFDSEGATDADGKGILNAAIAKINEHITAIKAW